MHAPGLGPGQRCVPAHTPDSVSFIITVHPPAVSFPSKSPERRIVLVARSVHKRQLWLAGRQVDGEVPALIRVAQHPGLSLSVWSLHAAWFLFHSWIAVSWVSHRSLGDNSLRSGPVTPPGQVHAPQNLSPPPDLPWVPFHET